MVEEIEGGRDEGLSFEAAVERAMRKAPKEVRRELAAVMEEAKG